MTTEQSDQTKVGNLEEFNPNWQDPWVGGLSPSVSVWSDTSGPRTAFWPFERRDWTVITGLPA